MAIEVPKPGSDWMTVAQFALTYNGYERHGGFEKVAEIGNSAAHQWAVSRTVQGDLSTVRCALFFEQRRWRHFGEDPDPDTVAYLDAILERIGAMVGHTIDGDPDEGP